MDKQTLLKWIVAAIARGIAWLLAAKLGMEAAQAEDLASQAAGLLVALAVVGLTVYTSTRGRKKLLATPPPEKKAA